MEEEFEDESMGSEDDSMSDEDVEMEDDQIQIESRELQQALLDEEAKGTAINDIKELWAASNPLIESPQEGISLYTTYIYLLRRMNAPVEELTQVFLQGRECLERKFGDYWDENATYRRNFAYFLYTKAKQPEQALNVWKNILADDFQFDPYMWIEATRSERNFGSTENARALLYDGIGVKFDNPIDFYEYFLQFEREEGSRGQIDEALKRINASASRASRNKAQQKRQKQQDKPDKKGTQKRKADGHLEPMKSKEIEKFSNKPQPSKNGNGVEQKPVMKDADGFAIPSLPTKSAKPKTADQVKNEEIGQLIGPSIPSSAGAQESEGTSPPPLQGTDRTIFLSNIPFDWTADNIRRLFPNAVDFRIPHKTKGQNKGFAFVDFGTVEDANEALKSSGKLQVDGRDIQVFPNTQHQTDVKPGFRFATGKEKNKLFVRNVDFNSTEDQLREFFGQYGQLKDVRIVRFKNGKPKGVVYIEYNDEEAAMRGLAANQQTFNGRPLEIHISDPSLGKRHNEKPPVPEPSSLGNVLGGGQMKRNTLSLKPRILLDK